jgi:hypothetical protein
MNASVDTQYTSVMNDDRKHKRIQSLMQLSKCLCVDNVDDVKRIERNRKVNSVKVDECKIRRDVYGTIIVKGSKQHRISFIDNVGTIKNESVSDECSKIEEKEELQLVEVIKVQSYKKYNEAMSFTRNNKSYLTRDEVICCEVEGCILL